MEPIDPNKLPLQFEHVYPEVSEILVDHVECIIVLNDGPAPSICDNLYPTRYLPGL